jgi:AAA domain-containing protein/IclR-like helix-turn-helix domain-containing protein
MPEIAKHDGERKPGLSQEIEALFARARGDNPEECWLGAETAEASRWFFERMPNGSVEHYRIPRDDDYGDREDARSVIDQYNLSHDGEEKGGTMDFEQWMERTKGKPIISGRSIKVRWDALDPEIKIEKEVARSTSAKALTRMTFPDIKYVVPDIIVEGLTLLAGKPKIGKSWMLLDMAIAVAKGEYTLGDRDVLTGTERTPCNGIKCEQGDVLYCALEDNLRRLQSRLLKLLDGKASPERLDFVNEMPTLAKGGLDMVRAWITSKPHPRLVVIDTLAMVRDPAKRTQTTYEADYQSVKELHKLALDHRLAIIIVHHLRKAEADDAFDTISGTLGLSAAPDSVLVLARDSSGNVILHGKGRDLEEIEKAMIFDGERCTWYIEGEAADVKRSTERTMILNALAGADEPLGANDIAAETGMRAMNVRFLLRKLVAEGAIERAERGKYSLKK